MLEIVKEVLDLVAFLLVTPELLGRARLEWFRAKINHTLGGLGPGTVFDAVMDYFQDDSGKFSKSAAGLAVYFASCFLVDEVMARSGFFPAHWQVHVFLVLFVGAFVSGLMIYLIAVAASFSSHAIYLIFSRYQCSKIMLFIGAFLFFIARILGVLHAARG